MKHTLTLIIHLGVLLTWVKADFTNEDDYLKKMHNFSAYFDSSTFSRGLARENLDWATLRGKAEKACLKDRHFSDKTLDSDCSIYFVHNHKAGGTTMCNIAVKSEMRVVKPLRNCLEPDELRGSGKEGKLVEFIEHNRLQFVAHEFGPFLPLTKSTSHIVYVTVVRNPWDRVLSAAHHDLCQKTLQSARDATSLRHCTFDILTATAADIILDPCFSRSFSSVNHYVNKFSPCPAPGITGGVPQCGPKNTQEAMHLLELMSAIIVTDSPDTYERSFPVLTAISPKLRYESSLRAGTSAHSDAKYLLRHNISAWNTLVALNTEDYKFYKHALSMADYQRKKLRVGSSKLRGTMNEKSFDIISDMPYLIPPASDAPRVSASEPFCKF